LIFKIITGFNKAKLLTVTAGKRKHITLIMKHFTDLIKGNKKATGKVACNAHVVWKKSLY